MNVNSVTKKFKNETGKLGPLSANEAIFVLRIYIHIKTTVSVNNCVQDLGTHVPW